MLASVEGLFWASKRAVSARRASPDRPPVGGDWELTVEDGGWAGGLRFKTGLGGGAEGGVHEVHAVVGGGLGAGVAGEGAGGEGEAEAAGGTY